MDKKTGIQLVAVIVLVYVAGQMLAPPVTTTSRQQDKRDFAREYFIATLQPGPEQKRDVFGQVMSVVSMFFGGGGGAA